MFHNVEGLAKHFQCTFADEAFTGADILLFVETHGEADTQYDLDTFGFRELVRLTKTNRLRPRGGLGHNQSGSGSLIAVRQELFDECRANVNEVVIAVTPNRRVEMTTCTVRGITIVSVYKSPSVNQQELINALRGGLPDQIPEKLLIVGDFNVDMLDEAGSVGFKRFIAEDLQLLPLLGQDVAQHVTTDGGTQLDVAFSNIPQAVGSIYESATSYHKPLMITI
jgi:hypothetical protein